VEVALSEDERKAQETAGGYAREMSDDYKRRQAALIAERAQAADIVITTALVPGRPAPVLLPDETLAGMKPGSVVVDLAVTQGGNCAGSVRDQVVLRHGVKIVAPSNLPATLAADASALYARNLVHFTSLLLDSKTGELALNRSDEIIAATLVCIDGAPVRS
jgi:NAD(P) transhydrogenase subunit alpha